MMLPFTNKSKPLVPDEQVLINYRALPTWFVPVCLTFCMGFIGTYACSQIPELRTQVEGSIELLSNIKERGLNPVTDTDTSGCTATATLVYSPEHDLQERRTAERISTMLLAFAAISMLLAFAGRDKRLKISSRRLDFPKGMAPSLGFQLSRPWTELITLDLEKASVKDPQKSRALILQFKPNGKAKIYPERFTQKELELFFDSMDRFAAHCAKSPEVVALRHKLLSEQKAGSFTQVWEEEMSSHFAATNFVALSPGSLLQTGKIKITMHLSSGGLSAVYLAEKESSMVVVKESVVPAGTSETTKQKAGEMFQREANMLMRLTHPQIARVFDHFQENGRDYLLLEYIPGITLREYVRRNGKQDESKVVNWAKQIAGILAYLHEQDPPIIHRDVTPDNLIITPEGKVIMIDFGAANQFLGSATGTIIGKQFYIAPEQFRGKAEPASDIYSLGGTLFYLLTAKEPQALAKSKPRKVDDKISEAIDAIIAACTEPDSKVRIQSARELIAKLDNPLEKPQIKSTQSNADTDPSIDADTYPNPDLTPASGAQPLILDRKDELEPVKRSAR